jgi:hypothetical protein
MNNPYLISGLCILLIGVGFQPNIILFNVDVSFNHVQESLLDHSIDMIIYNPYADIDFNIVNHYKANLHTHTTQSDGSSPPAEVILHYHDVGGYNILALTDHNKNTWPWSKYITAESRYQSDSSAYYPDLNMLAISGNELSNGHHRGSILNGFSFGGLFIRFSFWFIERQEGLCFFNHPGRYEYGVEWYQRYFDEYDDCIIGLEVYNQGDRYCNDRILWDQINKERAPDDLIWGVSNDDMHHLSTHAFRNYQHVLMNGLTEDHFRNAMIDGSFYFSYEPNGSNDTDMYYGQAMAPHLTDVFIQDKIISISADSAQGIQWINENSQIISSNYSIDASKTQSNFVRAELINQFGITYTQPFGIETFVELKSP